VSGSPKLELATPVSAEHCDICGGSVVRTAVKNAINACARAAWRRLCIVGGSPTARQRIEMEVDRQLDLRLIDGTISRFKQEAKRDLEWADHCVVWGATQLSHKVSSLYQGHPRCTTIDSRGIEDVLNHIRDQALKATPPADRKLR
jgi:hypothetical protein